MQNAPTKLATGARLAHGCPMTAHIQFRAPGWVADALKREATVEQSKNTAALVLLMEALRARGYSPSGPKRIGFHEEESE